MSRSEKTEERCKINLSPFLQYFKAHGKGHISRMQAVLKAYVDAHRTQAK